MVQRPLFVRTISLLLPATLLLGCSPKRKSSTVVVHLLRNLSSTNGSELDRRILDFQGSDPRLKTGQPIMVESETGDYHQLLDKQTNSNTDVDLIVLDSPDDAKSNAAVMSQMASAVNVCAGLKACPTNIPAIIPTQITGDNREAAEDFRNFLQKTP